METTRWYLVKCEETESGYWRIKPDVVLPIGAFLKYFYPSEDDQSVALLRITHKDPTKLDKIESDPLLAGELKRMPKDSDWSQIKGAKEEVILTKFSIKTKLLANTEKTADIKISILERVDEKQDAVLYLEDRFNGKQIIEE